MPNLTLRNGRLMSFGVLSASRVQITFRLQSVAAYGKAEPATNRVARHCILSEGEGTSGNIGSDALERRQELPNMSLPAAYLAERLTRSLPTTDRGTLVTVGDAYEYWSALPEDRQLRQTWQRLSQLMLDGAPPTEVTHQLQIALFMDAKLDFRRPNTRQDCGTVSVEASEDPPQH
jgi:hypothetical protein